MLFCFILVSFSIGCIYYVEFFSKASPYDAASLHSTLADSFKMAVLHPSFSFSFFFEFFFHATCPPANNLKRYVKFLATQIIISIYSFCALQHRRNLLRTVPAGHLFFIWVHNTDTPCIWTENLSYRWSD